MFEPVTFAGITMPLISFILIGSAIAFFLVMQIARGMVFNKLQRLFDHEQFDAFLAAVDEPRMRFFIPAYNREYLRLNGYIAQDDASKARQSLDLLLAMRASIAQRDDLLFKAFQFYMQQESWDDAKTILDEMKSYKRHGKRTAECEKAWEIFGNGSFAYIDEMEEAFDGASYALKVSYALMLHAQYTSKRDEEAAKAWRDKARELLENPPRKGPADAS